MGVIRAVDRPTYDGTVREQVDRAVEAATQPPALADLLSEGDTWSVGGSPGRP